MFIGDFRTIRCPMSARDRLATLSAMETEVLCLLLQNLSTEAIAEQLAIDRQAVELHHAEIFAKLDVVTLIQVLNLVDTAARLVK